MILLVLRKYLSKRIYREERESKQAEGCGFHSGAFTKPRSLLQQFCNTVLANTILSSQQGLQYAAVNIGQAPLNSIVIKAKFFMV